MNDVQLDVVISVDETLVDLRRLRRRNLGFPFLKLATFNIVYLTPVHATSGGLYPNGLNSALRESGQTS